MSSHWYRHGGERKACHRRWNETKNLQCVRYEEKMARQKYQDNNEIKKWSLYPTVLFKSSFKYILSIYSFKLLWWSSTSFGLEAQDEILIAVLPNFMHFLYNSGTWYKLVYYFHVWYLFLMYMLAPIFLSFSLVIFSRVFYYLGR